ncbi:MAG: hypothetical protein JSR85_03060 [Proteobacteria bacterium]|nr:hypothetical protein [Pseudomonadota bacterium]
MFDVYVGDQFLKTPLGNSLEVPTLALAKAIEEEWEKDPSPHYGQKPLTSLVATALDRVAETRESYVSYAIQAVSNDVILFWASTPETLVKLQDMKWAPLIEKVNQMLGLSLKPRQDFSVLPLMPQEEEKVRTFLYHLTVFKLAGFVHLLTLTSSFYVSFLVLQTHLSPEEAWDLIHLHEQEQRRAWGADDDALLRDQASREEFFQTIKFLELSE